MIQQLASSIYHSWAYGARREVVHVFGAHADGVLGIDPSAISDALLDGLLHLEPLPFNI